MYILKSETPFGTHELDRYNKNFCYMQYKDHVRFYNQIILNCDF
jgi:hypothetical protein